MKKLMFLLLVLLVATGCGNRMEIKKDMDFEGNREVILKVDSVSITGQKLKSIGTFTGIMTRDGKNNYQILLDSTNTGSPKLISFRTEIKKVNGHTGLLLDAGIFDYKKDFPWLVYSKTNQSFWTQYYNGYYFDPSYSEISFSEHPYTVIMEFKD